MYADGLKQALRGKMYGDGVGTGTSVMGMGTGVMGMGRTSCPHAALYRKYKAIKFKFAVMQLFT